MSATGVRKAGWSTNDFGIHGKLTRVDPMDLQGLGYCVIFFRCSLIPILLKYVAFLCHICLCSID
jgi:hypothetical protein